MTDTDRVVDLFSAEWDARLAGSSGRGEPFALRVCEIAVTEFSFVLSQPDDASSSPRPGHAPLDSHAGAIGPREEPAQQGGQERRYFDFTVVLSAPVQQPHCQQLARPVTMMSVTAKLSHRLALELVGLSAEAMLERIHDGERRKAAKKQLRRSVEPLRGATCEVELREGTLVLLSRRAA